MPGPVVTELNDWDHWDGRALEPDDVADTVVFALSRPDHVELRNVSIDSTDKF
jgi:NADP-dependent 3-hydroxy acid dehydrogenase YdfG